MPIVQSTIPISYVLLVIAAIGVIVLYLASSRRSKPTDDGSERGLVEPGVDRTGPSQLVDRE